MGSSCGSRLPVRRLPEGPRLRAGWSSWEAGPERFCRGTGFALLPCPPADCRDTAAMNQPARRSLAAGLLALVRPPNVFTAVADSLAGLVLARRAGPVLGDPGLWCLTASACLYLGGIALNDYFDRAVDAVERPERPIPSGSVPPAVAAGLGAALLAAGIVLAALAGGPATAVAAVLALAVLVARGAALFAPLWTAPGGPATGRAISGGILMIPLFDATFVAAAGEASWAFAIASLTLPAMALRRMYSPT